VMIVACHCPSYDDDAVVADDDTLVELVFFGVCWILLLA
jgi:hypothetical protein